MELVSVNCNSCGAPLDVGAETRFATCGHCGARLEVKRTSSTAYTEILEKIDRINDVMTEHFAEIRRQKEVEKIDRDWDEFRKSFRESDSRSEPNFYAGIIVAVLMVMLGLFFLIFSIPLGLILIGSALLVGLVSLISATYYTEAKGRYERRRSAALAKEHNSADLPQSR